MLTKFIFPTLYPFAIIGTLVLPKISQDLKVITRRNIGQYDKKFLQILISKRKGQQRPCGRPKRVNFISIQYYNHHTMMITQIMFQISDIW